jgi:ligand-binding SRPBCC domain-containing protein
VTAFALQRTQLIARPLEDTFAFFADPWNLEAITPPWLRFSIVEAPRALRRGSRLDYRLRLFGVPIRWHTEIAAWVPPRSFTDVQLSGPYPLWEHTHRFRAVRGGTEMHDHVRYRVPGGPLAPLVRRLAVAVWLDRIFDYRADRLRQLLA